MNSDTASLNRNRSPVHGPQLGQAGQYAAVAVWLLFLAASLALFIPSVYLWDVFYSRPEQTLLALDDAQLRQNYDIFIRAIHELGSTPQFYGHFFSFLRVAAAFPYYLLSLLIMLRGRRYLVTVLFALLLLVFAAAGPLANPLWGSLQASFPTLYTIAILFNAILGSAVILLYCFPDGAFIPRWTRLAAPLVLLLVGFSNFLPGSPLDYWSWPQPLPVLINLVIVGSGGYALWRRYRVHSDAAQRQQIKWFLAGVILILLNWLGDFFFITVYPALTGEWLFSQVRTDLIREILQETAWYISSFLLALCIGISIFQYRLWDIDLILRRTLIYALLSAALVGIYFTLVIVLQEIFVRLSGQVSPISLVISTLVIAALFNPLRLRIQASIDRRFFRRRYNAEQIVEAFSAQLRSEIDLDDIHSELLTAVDQALQPAHLSLWVRKSTPRSSLFNEKASG